MEILVELGHEISAAANAQRGFNVAPIFEPNVILLDLTMPGMSGFEALRQFRRHHPRGRSSSSPRTSSLRSHDWSVRKAPSRTSRSRSTWRRWTSSFERR
jgi:CheY-like chemotaxis protein